MSKRRFYNFDSFRVDPSERVLFRDGKPLPLSPKVFDTLLALVERSGHIVSKDELFGIVWPDVYVEENNLTQYVAAARRALGDDRHAQRYIETVPKRGYRFAPAVRLVTEESDGVLIEEQESLRIVVRDKIEEQEISAVGHSARALLHGRWLVPAVLTGAMLLAAAGLVDLRFRNSRQTKQPAAAPIKSIAILPFKPLGANKDDDYLGIGMADALITRLGHIRRISIRPTSAIQKYTSGEHDPGTIGRELNVDAVLDCRIQRSGKGIRVTAQLVSVRDGAALWTESFDEKYSDFFAMEDSISSQLAQAIIPNLTGDEQNLLKKRYTQNSEAYLACLKGRYFWNKRTQMMKAVEYFQQATHLDPNYAPAYAGLADCYLVGGTGPGTPGDAAKTAALKALEIDDTVAEAHTSLAYYEGAVEWNWSGAELEFQRAIELNPNYPTAHHWRAYNLAAMGRLDEAVAEIKHAQELDPLSLIINTDTGHMLYLSRRYDEAIAQYRKVLEMDPNFRVAHWRLGESYAQKRMYAEAIAELQRALSLDTNDRSPEAWLGYARAVAGERDEALEVVGHLKMISKAPFGVAMIYAGLEDRDQAFTWLQKAIKQRQADLALIQVEPIFDSLRADPRYGDLLQRMKLRS